ncbi:GNAT family N-acetyltransferase [Paenibacillus pabuli]|uniref:GNAT family N-acetyltransferase n=1 Tax=Paenibacillus pabuli TaxID=1472 RepID=UPI003CEF4EA2
MIVPLHEAIKIYNKIPEERRSFYYHPSYIMIDAIYKKDLEPLFFARERNGNIFYHAVHLGHVLGTSYTDIQSSYGYGGPICIGQENFINDCVKEYKTWCRDNAVLVEFVRFHPLLNNEDYYYGHVSENRRVVYVDIGDQDVFHQFSTRVRTAIRKAEKNNVSVNFVKSNKNINCFIDMYNVLMNKKNAGENYFFNEEYFTQLLEQDNVYLGSAENAEGKVIGASVFFVSGQIAEYHLSASNEEGRLKNVTNLLIYEFIKHIQNKNIKFLYLGGGTDRTGDNALLFFKKGFSKKETLFKIGSFVHDEVAYENLKVEFVREQPEKEKFILFYR